MNTLPSSALTATSVNKDNDFFGFNAWWAFLILCVLYGTATYIAQKLVMSEEVYYNTLGEQLTAERIGEILAMRGKVTWVQIVILPIFILLQVAAISFIFNVGALVSNIPLKYDRIYATVLKASLIFGIAKVIHACLCVFFPISTLDDIARADVFSLNGWLAFLEISVHDLLTYPFSLVSVVEIGFCFLLIKAFRQLVPTSAKGYDNISSLVWGSYGITLVFWVILMLFLQINTM